MSEKISSKTYILVVVLVMVCFLLLSNIYITYLNSGVIERNKSIQEETERIKVNTLDIIRNIHSLDQSVRGLALVGLPQFNSSMQYAIINNDSIFRRLEGPLKKQNYPMAEFKELKDSVSAYIALINHMRDLLQNNQREQFLSILSKDRGHSTWLVYKRFSDNVTIFENKIESKAEGQYRHALRNSYLLQIMLFLLIIPALAYTTYYAGKTLMLSEQLRHSEEQRNSMLARQNVKLEQMVQERTNEILSQNEEISAQNEEITAHNEQLVSQQEQIESQHFNLVRQHEELMQAKRIIEEQNRTIQLKNDALKTDVERQTHDLKQTNLELVEQNNRLEQFAYIISHNLRAPMARLVGLSVILDLAKNEEERANIVKLMVKSTHDLDQVIKDLSYILGISRLNTKVLHDTRLEALIEKVKTMLEGEIKETGAIIETDFGEVSSIISLPQYLESIFYNLLSNSIKYRHPHKTPVIRISSQQADEFIKIEVADNGLGIDIDRYQATLFNLYKRFHFHVEGKGMGLYLVKTQIAALGGKIEVKSQLDKGTTFVIYLRNGTLPPRFISESEATLQAE